MSKSPLNGGYEIKCTKTHQLTMEEYKQYSIALWDAYRQFTQETIMSVLNTAANR